MTLNWLSCFKVCGNWRYLLGIFQVRNPFGTSLIALLHIPYNIHSAQTLVGPCSSTRFCTLIWHVSASRADNTPCNSYSPQSFMTLDIHSLEHRMLQLGRHWSLATQYHQTSREITDSISFLDRTQCHTRACLCLCSHRGYPFDLFQLDISNYDLTKIRLT